MGKVKHELEQGFELPPEVTSAPGSLCPSAAGHPTQNLILGVVDDSTSQRVPLKMRAPTGQEWDPASCDGDTEALDADESS
jgi:hypothetical protein